MNNNPYDRNYGNKAISWYKQGRCPSCGKKFGDPRGLEYRKRTRDLFCHACRKVWPMEIEPTILVDGINSVSTSDLEFVRLEPQVSALAAFKANQGKSNGRIFLKLFKRIARKR